MKIGNDFFLSSILVVGDAMLDRYWFGDVERISPEAPVPVVQVRREEYRLGGAANVARNIASLGAKASLLSVVGRDEAAAKLEALLASSGIGSLLSADPEITTTVKLRVNGRSQQLLRIDFEDRPRGETLAHLTDSFRNALPTFNAVVFSDYGKGGLAHIATMIAQARNAGKPVLVDPKGDDFTPYRGATIITPNRAELARIVGQWADQQDFEDRARALRERLEIDALLVTRSEEGMSLFDEEGHLHIAAQAREVFDVTGAGDTVIGTLATLVASGMPIRQAVPIANRAGSLVVGKFGTAIISVEELFG